MLFRDLKSQVGGLLVTPFPPSENRSRWQNPRSEGSGVLMRETPKKKKKLQICCLFQFKVALKTAALHSVPERGIYQVD